MKSRRISSSSGSASSGGGRVSKGGLAAGTAPNRIGADRNGAPVEEVDADDLYKVYDPVGLQKKWSIHEVARVVTALPELRLPWKKGALSASLESLDEEAFKAGINDSTTSLVEMPTWLLETVLSVVRVIARMHWTTISGPWLCFSTYGALPTGFGEEGRPTRAN